MNTKNNRAKGTQIDLFAVFVKAWNAERAGARPQYFSFKPGQEKFPRFGT